MVCLERDLCEVCGRVATLLLRLFDYHPAVGDFERDGWFCDGHPHGHCDCGDPCVLPPIVGGCRVRVGDLGL